MCHVTNIIYPYRIINCKRIQNARAHTERECKTYILAVILYLTNLFDFSQMLSHIHVMWVQLVLINNLSVSCSDFFFVLLLLLVACWVVELLLLFDTTKIDIAAYYCRAEYHLKQSNMFNFSTALKATVKGVWVSMYMKRENRECVSVSKHKWIDVLQSTTCSHYKIECVFCCTIFFL